MIVRMRLMKWDGTFEPSISLPFKIGFDMNSIGFLEVWDSLADMQMEYPDEQHYMEIKDATQTNEQR